MNSSTIDTYNANPNQFVYDKDHQPDFQVNVVDIYFAEKVPKYKWEARQEVYEVKSGGTVEDVIKKYEKDNRRNVKAVSNNGQSLKPKEKVTVTWEEAVEDGFEMKKTSWVSIKEELYIVAKVLGNSGTLKIEIHENRLNYKELIFQNPIKFLQANREVNSIEFTINGNKEYQTKISFKPKTDKDFKAIVQKFDSRGENKAYLYLKGSISGTNDEVVFPVSGNEFLNSEKNRFLLRCCDCGILYRNDVMCVRYGNVYGPLYKGSIPLKDFKKWDALVKEKVVSDSEKKILIAMSENEGNLDAVQSYDSEILTAGAMQKTINPSGYGELPIQIYEFKIKFPDKYECYLKSCGWEIEKETILKKDKAGKSVPSHYKYKAKYNGSSGIDLKNKIRDGFNASNSGKAVKSEPIEPIIKLMNDEDFQIKQIEDFVKRIKTALNKTATGYSTISNYIKSELGKATVLDHDVNRPGHVSDCFGDALTSFFKRHPKLSKDPVEWGEKFSEYEKEILEIYGPLRGSGNYSMTNATSRYNNLKGKL